MAELISLGDHSVEVEGEHDQEYIVTHEQTEEEQTPSTNYVDRPHAHSEHLRMMLLAVDAVTSGRLSQREASKEFNIARSTLRSYLPRHETYKHLVQKPHNSFKGKTLLTKKEEKSLVEYLINMHRAGFGRTKGDLLYKVQDMLNKAERKTKFENNMPDDEWYEAFLGRQKDSIKECIIDFGVQDKGIIPVDLYEIPQAIEVAIQSVPHASTQQYVTHQQIVEQQQQVQQQQQQQQQQQHQLQQVQQHHLVQRGFTTPDALRARQITFPFQL